MSYPRKLQTLVIEDDEGWIKRHCGQFRRIATRYFTDLGLAVPENADIWSNPVVAEPIVKRSFDDALLELESDHIYHIVICDLRLPWQIRHDADEAVEPGKRLIEKAANRDHRPIPVMLVVSGNISKSESSLYEDLERWFFWGKVVNKGVGDEDAMLLQAVLEAHKYVDYGILLRDVPGKTFPTVSPREDDILRRVLKAQPVSLGVDLEWWGYESEHFGPEQFRGHVRTKVLIGQFILDHGHGVSLPSFFKFEPADTADHVHFEANILNQKLAHIKVVSTFSASKRSLLITQKVGTTTGRPQTLLSFLRQPCTVVRPALHRIAGDIVKQLDQLGSCNEEPRRLREWLWSDHDDDVITQAWERFRDTRSNDEASVVEYLAEIAESPSDLWAPVRSSTHGDLHAGNVAIDGDADDIHGYIFDAGGMRADIAYRDLAALEVSSILHQETETGISLIDYCRPLYGGAETAISPAGDYKASDVEINTFEFITALRNAGAIQAGIGTYALIVFDYALVQLGGLVRQTSGNKIRNAPDASVFASVVCKWLKVVRSDPQAV